MVKVEQVNNSGIMINIEGNAESVTALQLTGFGSGLEAEDSISKQIFQKVNGGIIATLIGNNASLAVSVQQAYISPGAKGRAAQLVSNPLSAHFPPWKLPERNANHVGREDLFTTIDDQFSLTLGEATSYFGIFGLSGVGKTMAAVEYAHKVYQRNPKEYSLIIYWNGQALEEEIRQLAVWLGINYDSTVGIEAVARELYNQLFNLNKTLIIINDVENYEKVKELLPPCLSCDREPCCCILTSQQQITKGDTHFPFPSITLDQFTKEEALVYCQTILGVKEEQIADYKLLAEKLKYYPLALAQATSTIKQGVSLEDYLEAYEEDKVGALSQIKVSKDYPKTVPTALLINVYNIGQKSPAALKLLCQCAYLSSSNLTEDLLERLVGNTLQKSEAISCLIDFSIFICELREAKNTYRIPGLLQEILQLWLEEKLVIQDGQLKDNLYFIRDKFNINGDELYTQLLESVLVYSRFQNGDVSDILRRIALLPQLESLLKHIDNWKETNFELFRERAIKIAELYEATAMILEYSGGYEWQARLLYQVVKIWKKYKGNNSREAAMALNNLALALGNIGRSDDMLSNLQKALLIHQTCDEEEGRPNYATAAAHINLAIVYDKHNQSELMITELELALAIQEKVFKRNNWPLCISKVNLAIAYGKQNNFERKKNLLIEARKIQKKSKRNKWQPLEIATRINYANVLGELGDQKKRESKLHKLLKKLPFDAHPLKINILINLASAQGFLGKKDKQLETLNMAIQLQQQIFGYRHPETQQLKNLHKNVAGKPQVVIPSYDARASKYADPQPQPSKADAESWFQDAFNVLIRTLDIGNASQATLKERQKKLIEYKRKNKNNYLKLCKELPIIKLLIEKLQYLLLEETQLKVYLDGLCDVCWIYNEIIESYKNERPIYTQARLTPPISIIVAEISYRLNRCIANPHTTKRKSAGFQQAFILLIHDRLCTKLQESNTEKVSYEIQQLDSCANVLALSREIQSQDFFDAVFQLLVDTGEMQETSYESFFMDFWKQCLEAPVCYSIIMKNENFGEFDDSKTQNLSPDIVLAKLEKQPIWRNKILAQLFSFFTHKHCVIMTSDQMVYSKLQPFIDKVPENAFFFGYVASQKQYYVLKPTNTSENETFFAFLEGKEEEWANFQSLCTRIKEDDKYEKNLTTCISEPSNLSTTDVLNVGCLGTSINLSEKKEMGKKNEKVKGSDELKSNDSVSDAKQSEVKTEKLKSALSSRKDKKKDSSKAKKEESKISKPLELNTNTGMEGKKEHPIVANAEADVSLVPKVELARPTNCRELAQYYHTASDMEKIYLSQQITAWINSGKFPLGGDTWRDAIELLNMRDNGVSNTWLQKIYTVWQTNLAQGDWIRMALTRTLLQLQYFQPGVLSEGGAVTIMNQMLDWIEGAEELLGVIPAGAIEAWETVLAITSLLSLSFDKEVGVGHEVYEKFLKLLLKLTTNLSQLKSDYGKLEASYKKCLERKERGFKPKAEAKRLENEQKLAVLPEKIAKAELKYKRLEQLSTALEANRKIMEINWTRLQKLHAYGDVASNTFKTVIGAVTAVGAVAAGTTALAASIAATPVSCGAAALTIIPAAAGFSASIIGAGTMLYQAAWSAGAAGLTLHELWRNADEHPINKLFSNEINDNLLASIKAQYLDDAGNLRKEVKGDDCWHLVQFLRELLVHLRGAAALKEGLKPSVVEGLGGLLSAIYRTHAKSKHDLANTICMEIVALSQTLQEYFQLDIFNIGCGIPDNWVSVYQSQGWLPEYKTPRIALLGSSKEEFEAKHQKKLVSYLEQYRAIVTAAANQSKLPVGLPWYEWFYDLSAEQLSAIYKEYQAKAGSQLLGALKSTYFTCRSYIPLAQKHYTHQTMPPILSSWGLSLSESLILEIETLPELNESQKAAGGIKIRATAALVCNALAYQGLVDIKFGGAVTVLNAQQLEGVLKDEKLSNKEKLNIIEMQLNVINVSQPTPAERNVFTTTQNTKGDSEEYRLKSIEIATDVLSAEQEATREVEKLKLEQKEKRKAEAKEQRKQKEKQEVVIEKFTAANRLHTQFLRNFGTKAPIDGTWAAYDEAEAALNAIKFKAEVNEAMRLDIDKLLSSLEQYSAKHLAM